jgi:high-affinity nickel-transport protein
MSFLTLLALGFFLGMRHATDTDHVVAVTTIVTRERTPRAAIGIGALWGLGHTATILLVGGSIVVFGLVIPPHVGLSMEMSVAAMLVVLGAANLTGALRHIDQAAHGAHSAAHPPHLEEPPSDSRRHGRLWRPLAVGVVHGLAGSAAVALLVLTTVRDAASALVYLAVFGAGTVLGMMLLTTAMAAPIAALGARFGSLERTMARATGLVSIAVGLFLAYQIGVVDGLFSSQPVWDPH